jgi:acetyl-CoA decarbonylase/synthase, CODH/ACS complex subunit delta
MLVFPMLINPGYETSRVKESNFKKESYPEWGEPELLGAYWELASAMSLINSGAELIIMYHPKAVEIVKKNIKAMVSKG